MKPFLTLVLPWILVVALSVTLALVLHDKHAGDASHKALIASLENDRIQQLASFDAQAEMQQKQAEKELAEARKQAHDARSARDAERTTLLAEARAHRAKLAKLMAELARVSEAEVIVRDGRVTLTEEGALAIAEDCLTCRDELAGCKDECELQLMEARNTQMATLNQVKRQALEATGRVGILEADRDYWKAEAAAAKSAAWKDKLTWGGIGTAIGVVVGAAAVIGVDLATNSRLDIR